MAESRIEIVRIYPSWCRQRARRRPSPRACGRRRGFGPRCALALGRRIGGTTPVTDGDAGRTLEIPVGRRLMVELGRDYLPPRVSDNATVTLVRATGGIPTGRPMVGDRAGHGDPVVVHRFPLPSRFSPVCPSATGVEVVRECVRRALVNIEALLSPFAAVNDGVHYFGTQPFSTSYPETLTAPETPEYFPEADHDE